MMELRDALIDAELRKDAVRQAEQEYHVRLAVMDRLSRFQGFRRVLVSLGDLLVRWGCQLQTRFAPEAHSSSWAS